MRLTNRLKVARLKLLSKYFEDVSKGLVVGAMLVKNETSTQRVSDLILFALRVTVACVLICISLYFRKKEVQYDT